jgi:hypothetical protein
MPRQQMMVHIIIICDTMARINLVHKAPSADPFQVTGKYRSRTYTGLPGLSNFHPADNKG